jgi:predicted kinase
MEKVLIIVRGLPGSGKSTLASMLGKAICTADDWYMRKGVYKWDYKFIGEAHEWCQRKCWRFMQKDISPVIVANVSASARAMQPYINMAETFGYKVFTIVVENRHGKTNIHNVPTQTLLNMEEKFEIKLL